jgi:hypothetical protein
LFSDSRVSTWTKGVKFIHKYYQRIHLGIDTSLSGMTEQVMDALITIGTGKIG